MLNNKFNSKEEFISYTIQQKIRMEKGFLTCSERNQLKEMLKEDYKPTIINENKEKEKIPLIQDRKQLSQLCQEVTKDDNITEIVKKLKDALACYAGYGISACQIGINKRISYLKIPKFINKQLEFNEYIIINAKIIEKDRIIRLKNEACLSFPGLFIDTQRYVFCTVEYLNEKLEPQTGMFQDLESFAIQHECDHQYGILLFDRKWRAK
jgi:peptide deformylase